jgi:molybdopterin-containing oxidoreductase family molybdopterin binding subunit
MNIRLAAEARARGMKFVVFDPLCIGSSGKAKEWIPIIPGTDGAVALSMCNVILNDLEKWDEEYIKLKTNGPYLIGPDQRYMRDQESGEPLVWDAVEGKAKAHNDPSVHDFALEGEYGIDGIKCETAFQAMREHIKKYTPEMASQVSGVSPEKIRRIASEFAEAARIGSKIAIDGHELPFRPVSAVLFRGGEGHENSYHTCAAVCLLNQIMGAADVPGGTLGWTPVSFGFPETGKPDMHIGRGKDGMLTVDRFGSTFGLRRQGPWPPREPEFHGDPSLHDIFVHALHSPIFASRDQEEIWKKIGWDGKIEMMISWGANTIMSVGNNKTVADTLKKIPFIVVSELYSTELAEGFADILLPDTCYLEESDWLQGSGLAFNFPFGLDDWAYHILQTVVEPQHERRNFIDVMWELVDRIGKWDEFVEVLNRTYDFDDEYKLEPGERITRAELANRMLMGFFGPSHDWKWFERHGFITWPKKVEEAYWRWFNNCRVPIYLEHLVDIGEKTKGIIEKLKLPIDISQYTPLISWTPCSIHKIDDPNYDLYCFSYRDILHTGSHTMEQPWLDEASRMNPYTYNIVMHVDTAKRKGLREDDIIELESFDRRKVKGRLKVMKGIHEQAVGIAACSGHWAKGMPIAKGKGTNFDILLEIDLKHCDPICLNLETAVRVKAEKSG